MSDDSEADIVADMHLQHQLDELDKKLAQLGDQRAEIEALMATEDRPPEVSPELVEALAHLVVGRQDPVHRAFRAQVVLLVQERRVYLARSQIHKPGLVEDIQHILALLQ